MAVGQTVENGYFYEKQNPTKSLLPEKQSGSEWNGKGEGNFTCWANKTKASNFLIATEKYIQLFNKLKVSLVSRMLKG